MRRAGAATAITFISLIISACGVGGGGPDGTATGPVAAPGQPVPLSTDDSSTAFELQNTAAQTLPWQISVSHDPANPQAGDWFDISPREGELAPLERQLVTLVQHRDLAPGGYLSLLTVSYPGGETHLEVAGQVDPDGHWQDGETRIQGTVRTVNADVPVEPPAGIVTTFGTRSASSLKAEGSSGERLVVRLDEGFETLSAAEAQARIELLAREVGARVVRTSGGVAILELPLGSDAEAVAARLAAEPVTDYVEPAVRFRLHGVPNDPLTSQSWQLPVMGAPLAWEAQRAGTMPVVAVIDTGIDLDHEDLSGIFVSSGYDFCASANCGSRDSNPRPGSPGLATHGTHVTGLLAAHADNGTGMAGVIPSGARILPIKVFHDDYTDEIAVGDAIRWAAGGSVPGVPSNPNRAKIITLSLGASDDSQYVRDAVEFAARQGALIIASAGNDGDQSIDYPARYPQVIAVGSVNSRLQRSCFSDYGNELELMAPGGDYAGCGADQDEGLISTAPGNDYLVDAGTSMAAPLVAGAAAVTWSATPAADADLIRQRLSDSAYFDASYMTGNHYGRGVVRIDRAVGFPGPGDQASVQAVGPSTAVDTVTLDPFGHSTEFELTGLAAGGYDVVAEAWGRSLELSGSLSLEVPAAGDLEVPIPLAP